jgi:hypothetical protein
VIDCICGEKISQQKLRKHIEEHHEMNAIKAFMTAHFRNTDHIVPDSWECKKCRHLKNKEIMFISESTGIDHVKDEHINEAIKEFEDSLK